jgi:hypothetical protein
MFGGFGQVLEDREAVARWADESRRINRQSKGRR